MFDILLTFASTINIFFLVKKQKTSDPVGTDRLRLYLLQTQPFVDWYVLFSYFRTNVFVVPKAKSTTRQCTLLSSQIIFGR